MILELCYLFFFNSLNNPGEPLPSLGNSNGLYTFTFTQKTDMTISAHYPIIHGAQQICVVSLELIYLI